MMEELVGKRKKDNSGSMISSLSSKEVGICIHVKAQNSNAYHIPYQV